MRVRAHVLQILVLSFPLFIADLAVAGPVIADPPPLLVDITRDPPSGGGPSVEQPGYLRFEGVEGGGNPDFTETYASPLGVGSTVDVTIGGYTHFRTYPSITVGPGVPISDLLNDNTLRNSPGTIELTLDNLLDGTYEITTYHHDSSGGGGSARFDIDVTDASGFRDNVFADLATTGGTSPDPLTTPTFEFEVSGGNSVLIEFDTANAGGGNHTSLSGFDLFFFPPPEVPEPSTLILFGIALTLAGGYTWRRRRQARPLV